jgi:hypothetical protein
LRGLTSFYSDTIRYDIPRTLEETIRKERNLYEKRRLRLVFQNTLNDDMKGNREKRKKCLSHPFSRIILNKISKASQLKMNIRQPTILGKGKGDILYNVGDVRGITCIRIVIKKEKE